MAQKYRFKDGSNLTLSSDIDLLWLSAGINSISNELEKRLRANTLTLSALLIIVKSIHGDILRIRRLINKVEE